MKVGSLFLFIFCCLALGQNLIAQELQWTKELYQHWVDTRTGSDGEPVFWIEEGTVKSFPDGTLIAKTVGVDMARSLIATPDSIIQLSRKIFIYLDPETGAIMDTYKGNKVNHITYDYQLLSYVWADDHMRTWATQGKGSTLRTYGPGIEVKIRKLDNHLIFSAPLFIDRKTAEWSYQAYEHYDFIYDNTAESNKDKYQLIWSRYGTGPAWMNAIDIVTQRVAYRVDDWNDLPTKLKKYINERAPLWRKPPQGMAEIIQLQNQ